MSGAIKNHPVKQIPVIANKNQIQQVTVNLCSNAMDAMPQGGKLIVRTKKISLNGKDAVEIQIQDTGLGIPPEIKSKIFDPFFTTKDTSRGEDPQLIKGTGLGLFIVSQIVKRCGGRVFVESEVGKGTTFVIALPALSQSTSRSVAA